MRRHAAVALLALAAAALPAAAARALPPAQDPPPPPHSVALGKPWNGRLLHGVQLPEAAPGFLSFDAVLGEAPDRAGRRWGTQELVDTIEAVAASYAADHPEAPPVLVSDLSRPHGGPFGKAYGGLGHASHQNGLDVDVDYPRRDHALRLAGRPADVDRGLAQDLVDRFVEAGAEKIFVGLHVGLTGPRKVVFAIPHHDDHLHVRIPNPGT